MKICNMLVFMLMSIIVVNAQHLPEKYSRIKIDLSATEVTEVARLGLEADHGEYVKGRYLINDYSKEEQQLLLENRIEYKVLIDDVASYYASQKSDSPHQRVATNCEIEDNLIQTPTNYKNGSMGGFLTYEQLMETLDEMYAKFPHLISERQQIGTVRTHEDRPIYWLKIGDKPSEEEVEPKILYTALHHAREPASLSQMVFYMWYLLENYETDHNVKFIVDNTSLYFIPCVNPDGYIYNEKTNPGGGGLWRKNRRKNEESAIGVDLNRNYGLEWGFDDIGSSSNPSSNTYRGPDEFSEPETQAVMQFSMLHNFKIILNYHSYGNLLIYPWGFNDQPTADDLIFKGFGESMTKDNNFLTGTGSETVGYTVNGGSDDWLYGELGSYSFTPEVGEPFHGFWPPADQIDRINKSALSQNLQAAALLHNYAEVKRISDRDGAVSFSVHSLSVDTSLVKVSVRSLSDELMFTKTAQTVRLAFGNKSEIGFNYEVEDLDELTTVNFEISVETSGYSKVDTFTKLLSRNLITKLDDKGNDLMNWESEGWGPTKTFAFSGDSSITDSPLSDYEPGTFSTLTLSEPIDLTDAMRASLEFQARWEIEESFDYAQVLISMDGVNFIPLCGKYTSKGSFFQDAGEPVYDGFQYTWVKEEMDLSEYFGEQIWIRFLLSSDDIENLDGIYLDDIKVLVDRAVINSSSDNLVQGSKFQITPNPFITDFDILANGDEGEILPSGLEVRVFDELGVIVDRNNLSSGLYFVEIIINGERQAILKAIKSK